MEEKDEMKDCKTEEKKELIAEKEEEIQNTLKKQEPEKKEGPEIIQDSLPGEEISLLQKVEELTKVLKTKEKELQKEHDRWLRSVAELENYKKRMAREKAEILKFGNESLMRELLSVIDNLELSLEHARNANNIEAITQGIDLVRKEFLQKLEKFGLRAISVKVGEKFDPNKHEATARVETSEHPEDTIIKEFQKGYMFHERLLRPSRVSVAKPPRDLKIDN
jgi:molecular chaperone GrpE